MFKTIGYFNLNKFHIAKVYGAVHILCQPKMGVQTPLPSCQPKIRNLLTPLPQLSEKPEIGLPTLPVVINHIFSHSNMWHMTPDTWHVTCCGGWTFFKNFSSLALVVCDLWYLGRSGGKGSPTHLITKVFVEQPWLHWVC